MLTLVLFLLVLLLSGLLIYGAYRYARLRAELNSRKQQLRYQQIQLNGMYSAQEYD